jgi:hypothetical protein
MRDAATAARFARSEQFMIKPIRMLATGSHLREFAP